MRRTDPPNPVADEIAEAPPPASGWGPVRGGSLKGKVWSSVGSELRQTSNLRNRRAARDHISKCVRTYFDPTDQTPT